jgi:diguanylate cyclase (GGDEF)-like protein
LHARHQALHDSLTLLPNRHHFLLSLSHAIELATHQEDRSALAVFFVDLDGFKAINDEHGHAAGDELLGIVAARLARALRSNDVVGRMGGDEFACLLRDIREPGQLSRLACKVYDTVSAPIKIGDLIISVRPSIGVTTFPEGGGSSDALLKAADEAMYRAKREQTGYAFFEGGARSTP